MALKVKINGVSKSLTGPNHCPVTFINGKKQRLTKGITFINGQKKILWDVRSVIINYIDGVYTAVGKTNVNFVTASGNKLFVCSESYSEGKLMRLDISNLSAPVLENSVQNGTVTSFSTPDSNQNTMSFFGFWSASTSTFTNNQININPQTMEVAVSNSQTLTYSNSITPIMPIYINDNGKTWLTYIRSSSFQSIYSGTTRVYNLSPRPSSTLNQIQPTLQKWSPSEGFGIYADYSNSKIGIARYTVGAASLFITEKNYRDTMIDSLGRIVGAGAFGFGVYTSTGVAVFEKATRDTYRMCQIVGECRQAYYVLDVPDYRQDNDGAVAYLDIYSLTGDLIDTIQLDLSLVYSTSYNPTYRWSPAQTMPQISYTGVLGFKWVTGPFAAANSQAKIVQILCY